MFTRNGPCEALFLACCALGCTEMPERDPRYCDMSHLLPIWIVETDPEVVEYQRKDLDRDRGIEQMLVIPVYRNYRHARGTDRVAIAHPFLCRPGEEIEPRLRSFGQRERLARLIVWARGYFPGSIGGNFIWSPVVNGRRMIVKQLQRCVGSEDAEIRAAMKELLESDSFVVGRGPKSPPIPNTREVITVDFHYDAAVLVRAEGYFGRFYRDGIPEHTELLWAYDVGTKIVNRFTAEDKKMVAAFAAAEPEKKGKSEARVLEGRYVGEGLERLCFVFKDGKCYCIDTATNEQMETKYLIKGDKLYIAPIVSEGEKMIRNAWPVYTIKGDTLESSHVEDMDTGEVFYKDRLPRIILKKQ